MGADFLFERIPLALCGGDTIGRKGNLKTIRREELRLIRWNLTSCYSWRWNVQLKMCPYFEGEQVEFANDLHVGCGRNKRIKDRCFSVGC